MHDDNHNLGYLISYHNIILFLAHRTASFLLSTFITVQYRYLREVANTSNVVYHNRQHHQKLPCKRFGSWSESSKLVLIFGEAINGKREICEMEMRGLDLNKVNRLRRHNQFWFRQKLTLGRNEYFIIRQIFVNIRQYSE